MYYFIRINKEWVTLGNNVDKAVSARTMHVCFLLFLTGTTLVLDETTERESTRRCGIACCSEPVEGQEIYCCRHRRERTRARSREYMRKKRALVKQALKRSERMCQWCALKPAAANSQFCSKECRAERKDMLLAIEAAEGAGDAAEAERLRAIVVGRSSAAETPNVTCKNPRNPDCDGRIYEYKEP